MVSLARARSRAGRPLTGARIETASRTERHRRELRSPPHGGADRNKNLYAAKNRMGVAPSRGRGSKLPLHIRIEQGEESPPHGGADRNRDPGVLGAKVQVAPSRGRGSKLHLGARVVAVVGSPPHGGADRNSLPPAPPMILALSPPHGGADRNNSSQLLATSNQGRPLTGARIETSGGAPSRSRPAVAPSRGRGSKPRLCGDRGAWDGSPPHGGADRNSSGWSDTRSISCRPLTGARIETGSAAPRPRSRPSPPHGGADRNPGARHALARAHVAPHGGADRNLTVSSGRPEAAGRPLTGARIETKRPTSAPWL